MKKILLSVMVLAMIVVPTGRALADCTAPTFIANAAQGAFTGFSATAANVSGKLWFFGKSVPGTSGGAAVSYECCSGTAPCAGAAVGCDYGTMSVVPEAGCGLADATKMFYDASACGIGGAGDWVVYTDLNYSGFDGCPDVENVIDAADRVVIAMTDSTGRYAVLSRTGNGADFGNIDDAGQAAAVVIPSGLNHTLTSIPGSNPAVVTINLQNLPGDGLGTYGVGDAPGSAIITGWRVFQKESAGVPADLNISSGAWTSTGSTTASATSASIAGVNVPLPAANLRYLALAPVFEGGYVADHVGTPMASVGPTAAGVFASFAATGSGTTVTTNWTSNVETDVVSYQPMWAPALSGPFKNGGSTVAPKGNGQAYASSFGVPALKSGSVVYVKVRANKAGGGYEDTQVRKVLLGGAGPVA